MKTLNGHQIRQCREAAGLSRPALIRLLDRMDDPAGPRFTGWTVYSLTGLEKSGTELSELASAEFHRAFAAAPDAGNEHRLAAERQDRLNEAINRAQLRYAERDGFISDDDLLDIANDLTPGFEYPEDDDAEIPAEIYAARDELLEALYAALAPESDPDPRSWEAVRQTGAFAVALDIARQERVTEIRLAQARQQNDDDIFSAALRAHRNDNNVLWGAARILATMVNDDELGVLQVLKAELDRQDAGQPA